MIKAGLEVPKTGAKLDDADAFVLEAHRAANGNIFLLLFLPNNKSSHFATGMYVGKGQWLFGHYFQIINEAVADFLER